MDTQLPLSFVNELYRITEPERVLTEANACLVYAYDHSQRSAQPQAVVFPVNQEEIVQIVRLCGHHRIPITARGLASNTTGAAIPIHGGITLSFERFNHILTMNADDRYMIVTPGVTNAEVQEAARTQQLFWAPDPGSAAFCTVGGNLSCNAAGPRAIKYGSTREHVLGLSFVSGTGDVITTGGLTTKGAVGYDFTRLLIGSEGTLGIITQAILKLTPLPEAEATLRFAYRTVTAAMHAVSRLNRAPIAPSAIEFLDSTALRLLRTQAHIPLPPEASALLLVKVEGAHHSIASQAQLLRDIGDDPAALLAEVANSPAQAEEFWTARKALSPTLRTLAPYKLNEDVVVPISRLSELLNFIAEQAQTHQLLIVNFGHAGNGNIHVNIMHDETQRSSGKVQRVLANILHHVIALGGTISGEHGIGLAKQEFVPWVLGPTTINLMQQVKKVFDPHTILNPGKIFP